MGILLFNWYGYQLLFLYWQQQAEINLETRLDQEDYDQSQLVSVKVPIAEIPYFCNSTSFERVNGQVVLGGIQYSYVKRRIRIDTLELLCIPNPTAMRLLMNKNEFFRQVNDLHQQNQGKKSSSTSLKDFSKDYTEATMTVAVPYLAALSLRARCLSTCPDLPSCCQPAVEIPPESLV